MIAGSTPDGVTDLEFSPPVGKRPSRVAPPLGDVVAAQDVVIRQLQNTVAHNAEELHAQRNAITSLTARIYALEQERTYYTPEYLTAAVAKLVAANPPFGAALEQHTGIGHE